MLSLSIDLATFEPLSYRDLYALLLGVEQQRVRVAAEAGSTIVTTKVETADEVELQRLSTILTSLTPAQASLALGVDVETIDSAVEAFEPPGNELPLLITVVTIAAAVTAVALAVVLVVCQRRRACQTTSGAAAAQGGQRVQGVVPVETQPQRPGASSNGAAAYSVVPPVVMGTLVERPGKASDRPDQRVSLERAWGNHV